MTSLDLYHEATRRGLRLEPRGDKLVVIPGDQVSPEFAAALRQHKRELICWLESKSANIPADCRPWLHVARQVLDGEFDNCDRSTRESLVIGLRGIEHPTCSRALHKLKSRKIKP